MSLCECTWWPNHSYLSSSGFSFWLSRILQNLRSVLLVIITTSSTSDDLDHTETRYINRLCLQSSELEFAGICGFCLGQIHPLQQQGEGHINGHDILRAGAEQVVDNYNCGLVLAGRGFCGCDCSPTLLRRSVWSCLSTELLCTAGASLVLLENERKQRRVRIRVR